MIGSRKLIHMLLLQVITALILILCRGERGIATEKKFLRTIRTNIGAPQFNNENTLPIQLGIKEGLYKKEGIEADFLLVKGFTIIPGLISGDLDYGIYGGTTIRAIAAGMPVKVVMSNRNRSGLSLVGSQGIQSVKDLKGKIIGVATIGDAMDYAARAVLRHYGLDPDKDVIMRPVGVGQMTYLALKTGSVDAGIMVVLSGIQLVQEKRGFKVLMEVDEVRKGVNNNIVVSLKKLKEEQGEIKRVIRGTLKAIDYIRKNRERITAYMVKEWGIDREIALLYYERIIDGYIPDGKVPDENFQSEVKEAQERGLLSSGLKVPTSHLRDYSLLEEVLKEMGIK